MSEKISIKGMCGKELIGKSWNGGVSLKCPGEWTVISYPKKGFLWFRGTVWDECDGCNKASIKGE